MMSLKSYRDLVVWHKAMDLVVECYRITNLLPKNETYGLISQIHEPQFPSRRTLLKATDETTWSTAYITCPYQMVP